MRLLNNGWLEIVSLPLPQVVRGKPQLTLIKVEYIKKIARRHDIEATIIEFGDAEDSFILVAETLEQIRELLCK